MRTESTEDTSIPELVLRRAEGALLYPAGGLSRTPTYDRLFQMPNLLTYAPALGVTSADKGIIVLVRQSGLMFLGFYDMQNQQGLGVIYAGHDPDNPPVGIPDMDAGTPSVQLLWKGLATQRRWTGTRSSISVLMGNGFDPNLVLETTTPVTIRPANDQMRPLKPYASMIGSPDAFHQDATLQAGNVLFIALEAGFQPIADPPYRRDRGNYVQVSVVQSGYNYFSSRLEGLGTLIDPFIYTVLAPLTLPTEDQLSNFIAHDANAQGLVSAQVIGSPATITIFPPAPLTGGVAQFAATDVFAGPYAAVCITYCKKGHQPNSFTETMPSPVQTCQMSAGGRLSVTINADQAAYIAQYQTMRIYVADMSLATFALSPEFYSSFLLAYEVPNAPGTYFISPSMLQPGSVLSVEDRTAPPCSMFIYDAAQGRTVLSGNPDYPMRAWYLKAATQTDQAPEGLGIFSFLDFRSSVVGDQITALGYYRGQTVVYTKAGAFPFDSGSTTQRFAITTGAVNSRVVKTWTNGAQYFLGKDYNIYTLTQPVTDAKSEVPDFNLPLPQIGNYLQQYCDVSDSSFAHSVVDTLNKLWWIWLRSIEGGIIGFIINFETNQLTGPFHYPQFMSSEFTDDGDTRMVGMDLAGNLFYMDVKSLTSVGEPFTNDAPLTLYNPMDNPGADNDGFGMALVNINGNPKYVKRANIIRLQSPWLNFGDAVGRKTFLAFAWQVIQGSTGLVWVVVFNEKGQKIVRYYGDVFNRKLPPRVLIRLQGNLLQFMLIILVGDDRPFALRNITIEFGPCGQI